MSNNKTTTMANSDIIENLRKAMESGDNHAFIDQFADNCVFEQPFALNSTQGRIEGIEKLRAAFGVTNPLRQQFEIAKVHTLIYESNDADMATVAFSIEGKTIATGVPFHITSSVAIIAFQNGKIIHYRDYNNAIGAAKIAGALSQLATSLTK